MMIASLNSPDIGPKTYWPYSHWQKKIISSTSNKMLVEFRSDDIREFDFDIFDLEFNGFSASIHYLPLPSKQCEMGLNMIMKTIQSPNYPNWYDNNLACKWLISVPHGSHITLIFTTFDVRFSIIFISNLFSMYFYCLFY